MRFPLRDFDTSQAANITQEPDQIETLLPPSTEVLPEAVATVAATLYDEEDIKNAKAEAFAAGRAAALEELESVKNMRAQEKIQALRQIVIALAEATRHIERVKQEITQDCALLAYTVAKKITFNLEKHVAASQMIDFIKATITEAMPPAPLIIIVHPKVAGAITEACSSLIAAGEVEVISVEDSDLGDCRLEWDGGEIVRNQQQILSSLEQALQGRELLGITSSRP